MFFHSLWRRLATISLLVPVIAVSAAHAFTINGATAPARLKGVPIGGIGSGAFNFLPNGTYDRQYCQVQPATGVEPTVMVYQNSGTVWSTQALTTAAGMTISYTGYWPRVTNVYTNTNLRFKLTLDAFSPIYPGSNRDCSMPLAFFVFTLENTTASSMTAAIACRNNATASVVMSGTKVRGIAGNNITMLVKNSDTTAQVTSGANVADFTADGLLSNAAGGILASLVTLPAGATKTITFVIAWNNINGHYRKYLTTSGEIAQYGYDNSDALKAKVFNWQNKILNSNLPDWYKDILINNCHVLNSMVTWLANDSCTMRESSSAAGAEGCFDQRYYASMVTPIFAPLAEYHEMKLFAKYQAANGQIPHGTNGNSGDKSDINSEFALCLLRDYMWTGDYTFLTDLYPAAKRALTRNRNWDADRDGLTDGTYSTYDQPMYDGWMPVESEYCADVWLAAIKAGERLATVFGDAAMTDSCVAWFAQTSASFEKLNANHGFWNTANAGPTGLRGYYTGSNNLTANGGKGVASWASQLGGQWYADFLQLGQLHPEGRIDSVIRFIDACNKAEYGCYLAILPDRSNWFGKWPGTNPCGEQWPWFPPAHFGCPAIAQGFPDIGIDCVYRQWKSNYSGQVTSVGPIAWSSPVFMMVNGTDANDSWGRYRYMNPPGVFSTLFAITGFSIDVAERRLWIKPSIPTSMNKRLINAPLINPVSCGTLNYQDFSPTYMQKMKITFDSTMGVAEVWLKDPNPNVTPIYAMVMRNGIEIPVTPLRYGTGRAAQVMLPIPSGGVLVDQNGIHIVLADRPLMPEDTLADVVAVNGSTAAPKSRAASRETYALISGGMFRLPKNCSPGDMVEVYDLSGKMIARDIASRIFKLSGSRLANSVHLLKIRHLQ